MRRPLLKLGGPRVVKRDMRLRCPMCASTNVKVGIEGTPGDDMQLRSMDGGDVWQCRDCRYDNFLDSGVFDDNCPKGCMAVGIMSEREE